MILGKLTIRFGFLVSIISINSLYDSNVMSPSELTFGTDANNGNPGILILLASLTQFAP
jgi:hypothetical protein